MRTLDVAVVRGWSPWLGEEAGRHRHSSVSYQELLGGLKLYSYFYSKAPELSLKKCFRRVSATGQDHVKWRNNFLHKCKWDQLMLTAVLGTVLEPLSKIQQKSVWRSFTATVFLCEGRWFQSLGLLKWPFFFYRIQRQKEALMTIVTSSVSRRKIIKIVHGLLSISNTGNI